MPSNPPFSTWAQDPEQLEKQAGDTLEKREVKGEQAKIVKLKNVVPAIHFESGVAQIPPSTIAKLRSVLDSMRDLPNVRLHLVGHADSEPLSAQLINVFGDNQGLSRERAGEAAEFIQTALGLPPEAISFDWAGDTSDRSNATEASVRRNRRVEVEVLVRRVRAAGLEDVVVHEEIKRVKICRTETVCKLTYQEGQAKRARVKNLIPPLHAGEESVQVPSEFIQQIGQAMHDLRDKQHVTVKFIGYTDDAPLAGRAERIYGTHLALSKALAHRAALAVKDALKLPTAAIDSDGRGAERPIASNQTDRGRALNRRVEVEFWYDDPLQDLPEEPQICPDAAGADLVTVVYDRRGADRAAPARRARRGAGPGRLRRPLRRALGEWPTRPIRGCASSATRATRARAPHRARVRRRRRSLDRARAPRWTRSRPSSRSRRRRPSTRPRLSSPTTW
jgi:flagellar motor protein MotB